MTPERIFGSTTLFSRRPSELPRKVYCPDRREYEPKLAGKSYPTAPAGNSLEVV